MKKNSFVFCRSFYEAVKGLCDTERLAIYEAVADYALNGTEPDLTGNLRAVFTLIKARLKSPTKIGRN